MERSTPPVRLRADAERNRVRIVEAAQAAFADHGLDVPLEHVADDAGVGIATLYRRFPRREDLIEACFERRLAEYAQATEDALAADDGWPGFCAFVERLCGLQAADHGLRDVLTRSFDESSALEAHRVRAYRALVRLIHRLQADGFLRTDFVPEDLILLLMANGGVVAGTGDAAPDAWRRLIGMLLDGLRAEGASLLPPPPSPRQLLAAMDRRACDATR